MDGFRNHFHNCNREHVACAEREKILQVTARPLAVDHEIPAKQVAARGHQAEQGGKCDTKGKFVDHRGRQLLVFRLKFKEKTAYCHSWSRQKYIIAPNWAFRKLRTGN